MNIDDELQALSEQEATLAFTHFDAATAWELGAALKTAAERRGLSIAIEIQLAGQTLFITPCRAPHRTSPTGCGASAIW